MSTNKNIVALIGVRMESTRLPNKALADVHGKPFLQRLVDRIKQCRNIDKIVICTADTDQSRKLIPLAKLWGVDAFAGEEEDVMKRFIDCGEAFEATDIIRITGDNLFTDPVYLDKCIKQHNKFEAQYTRVNDLPLGVTAEVMSLDMVKEIYNSLDDKSQTEYMLMYAFNPDKYKCLVVDSDSNVQRPFYSLTCDTPEDLEHIRRLYALDLESSTGPTLEQVVEYMDTDSNRIEFSPQTTVKMPYGEQMTIADFFDWLNARKRKSITV